MRSVEVTGPAPTSPAINPATYPPLPEWSGPLNCAGIVTMVRP